MILLIEKLKYPSALDNPKYYCNYCNDKENVYDPAHAVADKSYCPGDDQNYCYDIK